ncbi:MAG: creatininase family protein [Pseudomonadota bacterium]
MRYWADLTTTDFEGIDAEATVALLPVGAIEQHGPHLPLSTDAVIAEEIARQGAEASSADVLVLPTQTIGKSTEHLAYPGTLTLETKTLLDLWTEIGVSVARAGVRKIVFLNAHGGQPQVMQIVARELRVREAMLAVSANWWDCGYPEGVIPAEEAAHGIHGGQSETSLMLHFRPDLVRMDQAEDFRPRTYDVHADNRLLRLTGAPAAAWMAQDIHQAGVAGNAAAATAEIGAEIANVAIQGLATLLEETARYPLAKLSSR